MFMLMDFQEPNNPRKHSNFLLVGTSAQSPSQPICIGPLWYTAVSLFYVSFKAKSSKKLILVGDTNDEAMHKIVREKCSIGISW